MGMNTLDLSDYPVAGRDYELKLPKGRLSPSQIASYLACGLRYSLDVLDEDETESVHTWEGTQHHSVLEKSINHKLVFGEHFEFKQATDSFRQSLHDTVDTVTEWYGSSAQTVMDRGVDFMSEFYGGDRIVDKVLGDVESAELEVEKEYAGVIVKGVVDAVCADKIVDLKVVGKTKPDAAKALQLSFYADMAGRSNVQFLYFRKLKTPVVQVSDVESRPLVDTERWLTYQVAHVAAAISRGVFIPTTPDQTFKCGPKTCPHWDKCYGSSLGATL